MIFETQIVCCQLKFENEINQNYIYFFKKYFFDFLRSIILLSGNLCNWFLWVIRKFCFWKYKQFHLKKKIENEEMIVKNLEGMFQPENNYPSLN